MRFDYERCCVAGGGGAAYVDWRAVDDLVLAYVALIEKGSDCGVEGPAACRNAGAQ